MTVVSEEGPEPDWARIGAFLRDRGAAELPHPGGSLLEHLVRVRDVLAAWGAGRAVVTAGFCHATYGTDGFAPSLMGLDARDVLAGLVGHRAEELVHLYASCDRARVYPRFGGPGPLLFADRFTGREFLPGAAELRAFCEITAANELDVVAHNPSLAARYGPALYRLLSRMDGFLSPAARTARDRQVGRSAADG